MWELDILRHSIRKLRTYEEIHTVFTRHLRCDGIYRFLSARGNDRYGRTRSRANRVYESSFDLTDALAQEARLEFGLRKKRALAGPFLFASPAPQFVRQPIAKIFCSKSSTPCALTPDLRVPIALVSSAARTVADSQSCPSLNRVHQASDPLAAMVAAISLADRPDNYSTPPFVPNHRGFKEDRGLIDESYGRGAGK